MIIDYKPVLAAIVNDATNTFCHEYETSSQSRMRSRTRPLQKKGFKLKFIILILTADRGELIQYNYSVPSSLLLINERRTKGVLLQSPQPKMERQSWYNAVNNDNRAIDERQTKLYRTHLYDPIAKR